MTVTDQCRDVADRHGGFGPGGGTGGRPDASAGQVSQVLPRTQRKIDAALVPISNPLRTARRAAVTRNLVVPSLVTTMGKNQAQTLISVFPGRDAGRFGAE